MMIDSVSLHSSHSLETLAHIVLCPILFGILINLRFGALYNVKMVKYWRKSSLFDLNFGHFIAKIGAQPRKYRVRSGA